MATYFFLLLDYLKCNRPEHSTFTKHFWYETHPFTYTVFLNPVCGNSHTPLVWGLNKDVWKSILAEEITISIPTEAILLLKD